MRIECIVGDIVEQADAEAIVNSANAGLRTGSGVAGAIHNAAGPDLERYCAQFAPLDFGKAVLTPGFNLPNEWIIHVRAGHFMFDAAAERHLDEALESALRTAEERGIRSMAIPAIGTGVFAFPPEIAAGITARVLKRHYSLDDAPRLVRICVTDRALQEAYLSALDKEGV